MHKLGEYQSKIAEPDNAFEPVDSSASAIGAQGLLRLGKYLTERNDADGKKYYNAGLTICETLLEETYLSTSDDHQGLLLHSIYHHPNGWDFTPEGSKVPNGESSMWGDYHFRELMLLLHRMNKGESYYTFFSGLV